jgi:hypothetical protein
MEAARWGGLLKLSGGEIAMSGPPRLNTHSWGSKLKASGGPSILLTRYAVRKGKTVHSAEKQTPITPLAVSQFRARGSQGRSRISLTQEPTVGLQYAGELISAFIERAGGSLKGKRPQPINSRGARSDEAHLASSARHSHTLIRFCAPKGLACFSAQPRFRGECIWASVSADDRSPLNHGDPS